MKKLLFILFISIFTLQSCTINSEVMYHNDSASTTVMDIDMKEAITMIKSMVPDSAKDNKKGFDELEKLPRVWTSFYDLEKKEGKLKTNNPDSVKIMKKIFVKSNFENSEISGFSLKMDHFTKADYNMISNFSKNDRLPIDQMAMNSWDGKTLIIDTEKFNLDSLKDVLASKGITDEAGDGSENDAEKAMGMVKMMYKKIGTTLKFEKKIKSITGKHDWIKKIDDYSIRIDYDLDSLFGDSKKTLKNSDKKIVIVTE